MTLLLDLLGASDDSADHAWVLRRALGFLDPIDAMRLVVAVLESGGRNARHRVHWLRFGDVPFPLMNEHELLGEAASHACWRALTVLLEDLRAKAPSWISLYDEAIEDAVDLATSGSLARATVVHCGTHYRFKSDFAKAAAAHGHLTAVQWLMPRSAEESGHVKSPPRERKDKHRYRQAWIDEVLKAAADNRHLHVVQWVVDAVPHLHCVLPYDDELQAVCWMKHEYYRQWKPYSATAKHGFCCATVRHPEDTVSTSSTRLSPPMPLADGFARDGDLDTLKKIRARPNYAQLIGPSAMALAAEHGHLDVLKWLFELFPRSLSPACFGSAASGGHVEILQWLQQQMPLDTASILLNAASKGHVEVLRWLQSTNLHAHWHLKARAVADAIQGEHLEVVKFLHEECKFAIEQCVIADHLSKCRSITMHEYALDRVGPLREREQRVFFERVVFRSSLEVLQYLVLDRGLWNRDALAAACQRSHLAMSQLMYTQAKTRARQLQTTLEEQLDFASIRIGYVWSREVAVWLLQCVPEAAVWGESTTSTSINDGFLEYPKRKQVLLACIRYRRAECRAVPWLPEWAVRVNSLEALKLLEASDHPNLRDFETFEAIVQHTRDARLMLKLLPLPDGSPPSLRKDVVHWAAQFGMVAVLDRVLGNEESKTQAKLLKQLVDQAGVSSHTEVVEWLLGRCGLLGVLGRSAAKAIPLDALRHGHTASLMLLRRRQLLRETSGAIAWMVSEAAQARQVRSLEWLVENLTIPENLIANTLIDAVRQNHTEIVAFITRKYEPNELHVRDHDRSGVRAFLLKQGSKAGTGVASTRQDEETSTSQDEAGSTHRRAKRARRE